MVREIGTLEFGDIIEQDLGALIGRRLWHKVILVRHMSFLEDIGVDTHPNDGQDLAIEFQLHGPP